MIAQIGLSNTENIEGNKEKVEGVKLEEHWNFRFDNNDFSETGPVSTSGTNGSVPGWTIELSQVALGPRDSICAGGVSNTIDGFAMEQIATHGAYEGAFSNRLSSAIDYSNTAVTQKENANGKIIDSDYAHEMAQLAKSRILQNAASGMIHKANKSKDLLPHLIEN